MRTRSGYWIGGALIVAGVLGAILWVTLSVSSISDKIDRFARVPAGDSKTLRLQARKYVIYHEGRNADQLSPGIDVTVAGADGRVVPTPWYITSLTYSFGGHEGSARATLRPPRAGRYRVSVSSGDEAAGAAIGESLSRPLLRTIAGAIGIGAILGLTGIALLVTTIVRRYNARKAAAGPAPPFGPPPPPGQAPPPSG